MKTDFERKRILVTGSRDWRDTGTVLEALTDEVLGNGGHPVTLVHGGCPTGADAIADAIFSAWQGATSGNFVIERHPADWATHGKAAGPIRNQQMVDAGADVCLAFIRNGSRGASHTARIAQAAGIRTVVFEVG